MAKVTPQNAVPIPIGRFLGRGSAKKAYASVYDGCNVAVVRGCEREELDLLHRMTEREHPYIVRLIAEIGPHTAVLELAEHGSIYDLQDALDFEKDAITSDHITEIVLQVQLGLNGIWDLNYVHGDVAERNVFVFSYGKCAADTLVKLGDLGEAHKSHCREIDIDMLIHMNLRLRRAWDEHLKMQSSSQSIALTN